VTIEEFRPEAETRIRRVESDYEPEEKALLRLLNRNGKN
jgi:hypothetical protein